ncbi:hypothetical protein ACFV0L_41365 [Streptosporangium canum]|uniref:hypothetical protein n=1 Tax=Streptosporangium canum TaxID=324952 RepID=UPI00368391EE
MAKAAFNVSSTLTAAPTAGSGSIADERMGVTAGPPPAALPGPAAPSSTPPPPEQAAAVEAPARVPIRVYVPAELADRVRGAVAALAYRTDDWASLNAATTAALERLVTEAEHQFNDGQPFPWTKGRQLQPGRRVGH